MRAILTYHSIDDSGSVLSVSPQTFEGHVRWMARCNVRVVSVAEVAALDDDGDALALTFDDGLESFATHAWPVLEAAGLCATLYVVTRRAGGTDDWNAGTQLRIPTQRLLDWDAIGRLQEKGVAIGSHTRTHADLTALGPSQLADEVEGSQHDIRAAIGVMPSSFAYPFGSVNAEAARAVRSFYGTACTTDLRTLGSRDESHLLPRLDMYYWHKPGQLERWGSTWFRRRLRLHGWLRRLRSAGTRAEPRGSSRAMCIGDGT